jgi:hypothetical protein
VISPVYIVSADQRPYSLSRFQTAILEPGCLFDLCVCDLYLASAFDLNVFNFESEKSSPLRNDWEIESFKPFKSSKNYLTFSSTFYRLFSLFKSRLISFVAFFITREYLIQTEIILADSLTTVITLAAVLKAFICI